MTSANVEQVLEAYWGARPLALEAYTAQVPILRYPRLTRDGGGGSMEAARFAAHMEALAQAGCTAVTFQDLKDYVEAGRELPEKPVAITLEGGGRDSPALAYPILKELGQRATLFVSGAALPPEAADYSGLIAVESQGFNPQDAPGRQGTLQKEGEPEEEYIQFLRQDCQAMDGLFQAALGRSPGVAAPPDGAYSLLRDLIWKEEGIYASVSSDARTNTLVKGLPQCLRAMGSYSVDPSCTAGQLLALLED